MADDEGFREEDTETPNEESSKGEPDDSDGESLETVTRVVEIDSESNIISEKPPGALISQAIRRFAFGEQSSVEKRKTLDQTFVLTEQVINDIENIVKDRFSMLEIVGGGGENISFKGELSYDDYGSESFTDIDDLIENANRRGGTPVSLDLTWRVLHGNMKVSEVNISFDTSKGVSQGSQVFSLLPTTPNSVINVRIAGEHRDWVEQSADDLIPKLENTKLGPLYKPLNLFRESIIVRISSLAFGWMGYFITFEYLTRTIGESNNAISIDQIIQTNNINEKLNLYIRYQNQEGPLLEVPLLLGTSFLVLGIIYFGSMRYLPKLSPKSGILVGVYESRWKGYDNLVRLVVFTGIYGGTISFIIITILQFIF